MDFRSRRRLLRIIEILESETDEEHGISWREMGDKLRQSGLEANQKTIIDDLDFLVGSGYATFVSGPRSVKLYRLRKRVFERYELRVLIDAVASARFLTDRETTRLIKKLQSLTSNHVRAKLQSQIHLSQRVKAKNEYVKYYIDQIHTAIEDSRKVSFHYQKYDVNLKLIRHRQGFRYIVSPYALVWNSDYYYLIGTQDGDEKIKTFRVDRLVGLNVMEETFERRSFDTSKYLEHTFNMYPGPVEPIEILFDEHLINVVVDRFGTDITVKKLGEHTFQIRVHAAISDGLVRWILTWGSDAIVVSPPHLVQRLMDEAEKMYRQYAGSPLLT